MMRTSVLVCVLVALLASLGALRAGEAAAKPRFRIEYATYFGGVAWDQAREVIVYPDGSVLVGAQVVSDGLPTTEGVVQPKYAGDDPALGHGGIYGGDCFLLRLSPDGSQVLAATYFGGSKQERNVYGMGLDSKGNVLITSCTRSADLPTAEGCFQPKYGGGQSDMMVAKLSPDLRKLLWCTYVGGSREDSPRGGLAIGPDDSVYVVGTTNSSDFPTTQGVVQPRLSGPRDSAIVRLKPDGSGLVFGTLLGGTREDDAIMGIRLDDAGNIYVAGHAKSSDFPVTAGAPQPKFGGESDCYLAKLSPDASRILYATYLGGQRNEFAEHRPFLLRDGSFLLTGVTASPDFPTTDKALQRELKGRTDGFLAKLAPDGRRLAFATLLGGAGGEFFLMPTPDAEGNIVVVGTTTSRDFPVTPDALQGTFRGPEGQGEGDGVLAIVSADGSKLLYATYLGGSGGDLIRGVALGSKGEIYLVGNTSSPDFPVTPNAVQKTHAGKGDAFIVKLVPNRR